MKKEKLHKEDDRECWRRVSLMRYPDRWEGSFPGSGNCKTETSEQRSMSSVNRCGTMQDDAHSNKSHLFPVVMPHLFSLPYPWSDVTFLCWFQHILFWVSRMHFSSLIKNTNFAVCKLWSTKQIWAPSSMVLGSEGLQSHSGLRTLLFTVPSLKKQSSAHQTRSYYGQNQVDKLFQEKSKIKDTNARSKILAQSTRNCLMNLIFDC